MREGIAYAGNLIVDRIRRIDCLPRRSELAAIHGTSRSAGGACNGAVILKRLAPQMPVSVCGAVGEDGEGDFILGHLAQNGIDTHGVLRRGETSFTDVYEESSTNCRTFFYFGGANDSFDAEDIDCAALTCRMLQICYPLLLPALDAPHAQYGTRMGLLLHRAREAGCLTALETMLALGVSRRAIIHAPTAAFGMDADGTFAHEMGKQLPDGFIRGTVGAGDAFCAGALLAAYRGLTLREALRFGNAAAVQSLRADTSCGAVVSMEECLAHYDALPYRQAGARKE